MWQRLNVWDALFFGKVPITEAQVAAIAGRAIVAAAARGGLPAPVARRMRQRRTKNAFARALRAALEEFERRHPEAEGQLFDLSYLEHEGADVLAQLLTPAGEADATVLAAGWATSINAQGSSRTALVREAEPLAADLLEALEVKLLDETDIADIVRDRRAQQLRDSVVALRSALAQNRATPGTRLDYLQWLIAQTSYVDPRGISQTQRQVQVRIDDVYVSLTAEPEIGAPIDRPSAADIDARLRRDQGVHEERDPEQLVAENPLVVVLGDPGAGKTTLLRHLAYQAARRIWTNEALTSALSDRLLPVYVRVAEYAEGGRWRNEPLSRFLPRYAVSHECPEPGLRDLLQQALADGYALVLIDGLDEIVDSDDRRGIVEKVEEFARHHSRGGTRIVVSSRVAGYRDAPLGRGYAHFRLQDLTDDQIRVFLERWCRAVEEVETPDKTPEERARTAAAEVSGVLSAIETSSGVRRLAANPLLLTVLALIHRTGARLPQRRVELYKLAAETLGRTWRSAQGVPESALVDEPYLTQILGSVAHWIHTHRPAGMATERELEGVIGREWARLAGVTWDPDAPSADIVAEIQRFLTTVRVHTGLFVERAPGRYGFMHLTFEEYFAARALVSRRQGLPERLRSYLHDPRWTEPLLLALGFVGMDYPEEAGDVLRTAVLAQGDEAQTLGLKPSRYESLLGRDFLFSLRCVADAIPVGSDLARDMAGQLVRELCHREGRGRFFSYRAMADELIPGLGRTRVGDRLRDEVRQTLGACKDKAARRRAAGVLCELAGGDPGVIVDLIELVADDDEEISDGAVGEIASLEHAAYAYGEVAQILHGALRNASRAPSRWAAAIAIADNEDDVAPPVIASLREAVGSKSWAMRYYGVSALGQAARRGGRVTRHMVLDSLTSVRSRDHYPIIDSILSVLQEDSEAVAHLADRAQDPDLDLISATALLRCSSDVGAAEAATAVLLVGAEASLAEDRNLASRGLGYASCTRQVRDALVRALNDRDPGVRAEAAISLVRQDAWTNDMLPALCVELKPEGADDEDLIKPLLGFAVNLEAENAETLNRILVEGLRCDAAETRAYVADIGYIVDDPSDELVGALINATTDLTPAVRHHSVHSLDLMGIEVDGERVLVPLLADENAAVRLVAAEALANLDELTARTILRADEMLDAADPPERYVLAAIAARDGHPRREVRDILISGLGEELDPWLRRHVMTAISALDKVGPDELAGLRDVILVSDEPYARRQAALALARVGYRIEHLNALVGNLLMSVLTEPGVFVEDEYGAMHADAIYDGVRALATGDFT